MQLLDRIRFIALSLCLLLPLSAADRRPRDGFSVLPNPNKLLFYNRIPKTGSASLVTVVEGAAAKLHSANSDFTHHGKVYPSNARKGNTSYAFAQRGSPHANASVDFCKHLMGLSTPGMYVHAFLCVYVCLKVCNWAPEITCVLLRRTSRLLHPLSLPVCCSGALAGRCTRYHGSHACIGVSCHVDASIGHCTLEIEIEERQ